jgi:hypothetical protein
VKKPTAIRIAPREATLKRRIRQHFAKLGFVKNDNGQLMPPGETKEVYRLMHAAQRGDKYARSREFVLGHSGALLKHFANGDDVDPDNVTPRLELVGADTWQSQLFRLATLYWRVPVSQGYGRRLRFLVWDDSNAKLIGLFALGDAVFNLKVRDHLIGWDHHVRAKRLVNMMDAYVLGAVPPYNMLLGGKLVACLIKTTDVVNIFRNKYAESVGVISNEKKNPRLVAVSTSSALGRSSIYNRLRLGETAYFESIGSTEGWGHFHIPDYLFSEMRGYLRSKRDPYANNFRYGSGPNWRMRAVRKVLGQLGLGELMARHGLKREVFFAKLATNAVEYLQGKKKRPKYEGLLNVEEVSNLALERWIKPRATRRPEFREWQRQAFLEELSNNVASGLPLKKGATCR